MEHEIRRPPLHAAPAQLRTLPDRCAPTAAWYVLRYFGKRVHADSLLRRLGWRAGVGASGWAIASALASYGLAVEVSADPDPNSSAEELEHRARAMARGVAVSPGRTVAELLESMQSEPVVPVLLYRRHPSEPLGHFVVLRGGQLGSALVADDAGKSFILLAELESRRAYPDIGRQTILVRRARAAV